MADQYAGIMGYATSRSMTEAVDKYYDDGYRAGWRAAIERNKPATPAPAADGCAGCVYYKPVLKFTFCRTCKRSPSLVDHYEPTPPTGGKA